MLSDLDFMTGGTEDRYPDVFDLAGGVDGGGRFDARAHLVTRLAALPNHTVTLRHDVAANTNFLAALAATL